jgi:hypothetical protein
MRLEVASVCICLLLISPIILQNVSAKLPVGASNQPIKLHQQETIAAKKLLFQMVQLTKTLSLITSQEKLQSLIIPL